MCILASCSDGRIRVYKVQLSHPPFNPVVKFYVQGSIQPVTIKCGVVSKEIISSLAFNYTGTRFAAGGEEGVLYIYSYLPHSMLKSPISNDQNDDQSDGPMLLAQLLHSKKIEDVSFSTDGMRVLCSCKDGTVNVWSCNTSTNEWKQLKSLCLHA